MENSMNCFMSSSIESVNEGSVIVDSDSDFCGDHLIKLETEDSRYKAVKNVFLSGMEKNSKDLQVTSICAFSHDTFSGQGPWDIFHMHSKAIAKKHGGCSNIKRAWYGASKEVIAGIARYGFVHLETIKHGVSFGSGIYLTPLQFAIRSAICSDADENRIQHMILCRVILGNAEQVRPGSKQFYPSSEEFDSGVDNLEKPGLYVVWGTHMNTHIFPEFIVSFKAPPPLQEFWDGYNWKKGAIRMSRRLSAAIHNRAPKRSPFKTAQAPLSAAFNKMQLPPKGPTSSWMPFTQLIAFLAKILPPASTKPIHKQYKEYRDGKITRDGFVRQLRQLAGDKLIVAAIKYARSKLPDKISSSLFGACAEHKANEMGLVRLMESSEMSCKQKVKVESSTVSSVCTGNSVTD